MEGRKRDCRVCFMLRGPDGRVTVEWLGWWGRRELRRYCEQRRERWSATGRTSVSQ